MARILLVDDEEAVLAALRRDLRPLDFEIEAFTEPQAAIRRAAEAGFDVVISDYRMPGMDGVSLIKKLKRLQPDLVAIMLSGFVDLRSVMQAINEAEIFRYLTKPWDGEKIRAVVVQALNRRTAPRDTVQVSQPQPTDGGQSERPQGAMAALEARLPGITQPGTAWERNHNADSGFRE